MHIISLRNITIPYKVHKHTVIGLLVPKELCPRKVR